MSGPRFNVRLRQLEGQAAALKPRPKMVIHIQCISREDVEEIRTLTRPKLFKELLERRFAKQPPLFDGVFRQVKCVRVAEVPFQADSESRSRETILLAIDCADIVA